MVNSSYYLFGVPLVPENLPLFQSGGKFQELFPVACHLIDLVGDKFIYFGIKFCGVFYLNEAPIVVLQARVRRPEQLPPNPDGPQVQLLSLGILHTMSMKYNERFQVIL